MTSPSTIFSLLKPWLSAVAIGFSLLSVISAFTVFSPVYAAEESKPQEQTRKTPALRNKVYEKLSAAQKASEAENYNEALTILDELKGRSGKRALNSYELANVFNLYAFIHYTEERYDQALNAYQNVVAQPDIPVGLEAGTRYTIAQLLMMQERWQAGLDELDHWFALSSTPGISAYTLSAQAYYQLKDYNRALDNMNTVIAMQRKKGKAPKEQWLVLTRFLYYENNNFPKVVDVLEELLQRYPKKDYWVQLSHVYGEMGLGNKQMSAMESAYQQGLLVSESELLNMAYLYLSGDVPFKAGNLLEKAISAGQVKPTAKNRELQANAWRRAQELDKAIIALQDAAQKSEKGELWAQLGNIYVDQEKYGKAIDAIITAQQKGSIKRPDSSLLSLGMAYFNTGQYSNARVAFEAAGKDKRSRKYADQWLKYMENEISRQQSLSAENG